MAIFYVNSPEGDNDMLLTWLIRQYPDYLRIKTIGDLRMIYPAGTGFTLIKHVGFFS